MTTHLRDSSFEGLAQCEKLFDILGFRMTSGAELEWYSMEPKNKSGMLSPLQVEKEFRKIPPDILSQSFTFRNNREDINERRIYQNIHNLLLFRIEQRMQQEEIPCSSTREEHGTIGSFFSNVTVVDYDGQSWKAIGQKLEVSLGTSESPVKTAQWLEKLHTIVREESQKLGLIADFRSKPPYTYMDTEGQNLLEEPMPGTSQHVHYGLIHKKPVRTKPPRTRLPPVKAGPIHWQRRLMSICWTC